MALTNAWTTHAKCSPLCVIAFSKAILHHFITDQFDLIAQIWPKISISIRYIWEGKGHFLLLLCVCARAKPFKSTAKFLSSHQEIECLPWAVCWQDGRNERAVKIDSIMQFRSVCAGEMDMSGPGPHRHNWLDHLYHKEHDKADFIWKVSHRRLLFIGFFSSSFIRLLFLYLSPPLYAHTCPGLKIP